MDLRVGRESKKNIGRREKRLQKEIKEMQRKREFN